MCQILKKHHPGYCVWEAGWGHQWTGPHLQPEGQPVQINTGLEDRGHPQCVHVTTGRNVEASLRTLAASCPFFWVICFMYIHIAMVINIIYIKIINIYIYNI